jgi:hypothetical protein
MPARSTSTRTIRGACIGALALAFVFLKPGLVTAQDRSSFPTEVKVTGDGTSATVTWTAVPFEGVTYRILRRAETEKVGVDRTKPVSVTSFVDSRLTGGLTYFYEVIAVFRDGTSASAEPVAYIAPIASVPEPVVIQPTAVKEITVAGTTASALVSWQPVPGAVSYSIRRFNPNAMTVYSTIPAIATTSSTDTGPKGMGFPLAGTYTYDVIAAMPTGMSVSGRATWTRPDATCDAPASGQPMLAALTPGAVTWIPKVPDLAGFQWTAGSNIMAYRVERSLPDSKLWMLMGTSCDGSIEVIYPGYTFLDRSGKIDPNTTYLYKVTALAPNGEAGERTFTYTAPGTSVMRWLSATTSGNTVTMKFRYEPPLTNAPILPSDNFYVTSPYGLNQLVAVGTGKPLLRESACMTAAGCSFVVNGVPSGTHVFTVTASWISGPIVLAKISANTSVIIP